MTDNSIEIPKELVIKEDIPKLEKTKKQWVLTPARKAAFERALLVRKSNIIKKQNEKKVVEDELNSIKQFLKNKKDNKKTKQTIRELQELETSSSSEEDEPPPPRIKRKAIKHNENSDSEEDHRKKPFQIIVNNHSVPPPIQQAAKTKPNVIFI